MIAVPFTYKSNKSHLYLLDFHLNKGVHDRVVHFTDFTKQAFSLLVLEM